MSANQIVNGELLSSVLTKMNQQFAAGIPFAVTAKLTALAAGTIVHVVPVASVGSTQRVHITSMLANVNGSTAWTDATGAVVKLQDTAAVAAVTIPKASLTGNVKLPLTDANVAVANTVLQGIGLTLGAGLDLVADHDFTAGSDLYVTVTGFIY